MKKSVVILGGGVAGLSAAHELSGRGYRVDVYDPRGDVGGKARSQPVRGTGAGQRADLPGEHGFRFYPSFYKHLIRTMEEIPLDPANEGGPTVADNLRPCDEAGVAPADGGGLRRFLRRKPENVFDLASTLQVFFEDLGVSMLDAGRFGKDILRYFVSCPARRLHDYEKISWWQYLRGDRYEPRFQKYLRAVPRIMVAMDARRGSARTVGDISMQLLQDYGKEGVNNDRTLIGPTTEAWLAPWKAHLERRGVRFHLNGGLAGFDFEEGRITGARIVGEAAPVTADFYVAAMPLEAAVHFVTDAMAAHSPELAKLLEIKERGLADSSGIVTDGQEKMTDWMVGIQLFLREDVPMVRGHVFYPDSPWALSSISQAQFWALSSKGRFRERYGDGTAGGVLSVDISDWNHEGTFIKKPAKLCTAEEIRIEVWAQIKEGLKGRGDPALTDDLLHPRYNLDQDLVFPDQGRGAPVNTSPLLVHPPRSWELRPTAATGVENLVLASDYVRTATILACMEGANEAARRAVNEILRLDGYEGSPCTLWELTEDPMFDVAKKIDARAYVERDIGPPPGLEGVWSDKPTDIADVRRLQDQITSLPRDR